jgi:hypothetical protein
MACFRLEGKRLLYWEEAKAVAITEYLYSDLGCTLSGLNVMVNEQGEMRGCIVEVSVVYSM